MFLFSRELAVLCAAVREGRPAHVVGHAGMGATTLLSRLRSLLEAEGYTVVAIDGAPYFREVEQAPLRRQSAPGILTQVDGLAQELLSNELRVVIVDGIENLDATTLQIIQAAAARTQTAVVFSRGVGVRALMHSDARYCRFAGTRIQLSPLDFATTALLIRHRLGGRPDVELVSNVYGLSGGITGLILAIVDGARDDGRLRLHEGRWRMRDRDLWNNGIDAWIERCIAEIDPSTFEVLTHLAVSHDARPWAPCEVVPHAALKDLEARGLLSVVAGPGGPEVRLLPPAMTDYFRHTHDGEGAASLCGQQQHRDLAGDTERIVALRSTRREVTDACAARASEWEAAHTVATALPYLEALMEKPRGSRVIDQVFADTPITTASTADEALDFVLMRSTSEGSLTKPNVQLLEELSSIFPSLRPALEMFTRLLEQGSRAVDSSPASMARLRYPGMSGESLCAATLAYVETLEGRFAGAANWEGRVPPCPLSVVDRYLGAVHSLVPLGRGDFASALARSTRSLDAARSHHDLPGVLLHSYYAALTLLALGRWTDALEIADHALAYGPPGAAHAGAYRALLWIASLINHWRGENGLAALLENQASALVVPDEALPAMQSEVGHILRSLIGGDGETAMVMARRLARRLARDRNLLPAICTLVSGLCIWPDRQTVAQLGELAEEAFGATRWPLVELIRASFEDPVGLPALAEAIAGTPHGPLASLVLAARARQELGHHSELTEAITAALAVLVDDEPVVGLPVPGFADQGHDTDPRRLADRLTPRETQVALLAATLPNMAVASALGIGVRTIENHLHSALKKTGAKDRHELFALLRTGR